MLTYGHASMLLLGEEPKQPIGIHQVENYLAYLLYGSSHTTNMLSNFRLKEYFHFFGLVNTFVFSA